MFGNTINGEPKLESEASYSSKSRMMHGKFYNERINPKILVPHTLLL